jgi:hypothetical protein
LWGRDKNFEVLRPFEHRYCEKKISQRDFFATPFISTFEVKTTCKGMLNTKYIVGNLGNYLQFRFEKFIIQFQTPIKMNIWKV